MKRFLALTLLICFINLFLPCFAQKINIKPGTIVEFSIAETKSSDNATEGERLPITIGKDIVINGTKVFKAGNRGYLNISEVSKRAFWGQGGKIIVSNGKIYDTRGDEHRIDFTKQYIGDDTTWSAVIAAFGLATIVFFPLGLFALIKGKDAKTTSNIILEGTIINGFTF